MYITLHPGKLVLDATLSGESAVRKILLLFITAILALGGLARPSMAHAQTPLQPDGQRLRISRDSLQSLLATYERSAGSGRLDPQMRARARYESELIRQRLSQGDFQVGDRVMLRVEGEEALTDTFRVNSAVALDLPSIGETSVRGLLRSELEPHLREYVGRFIRNPVVRAQPLIRVSVLGDVGAPGFYVLPADVLVTDALMTAGGPTRSSELTDVRIERGGEEIWGGEPLQTAIIEGRTLDQLSLQAGDRIVVPEDKGPAYTRILAGLGAISSVAYLLTLVF